MKSVHYGLVALLCLSAPGCALLGKSDPISPRYFTPERDEAVATAPAATDGPRLRLGRVQSGPNLRERIAYRSSASEVGYYLEKRWTERPEAYLRRALGRDLFEKRGVVRAVSGTAPTLDAELLAFEEIKEEGAVHRVRIQVVIMLDDGSGAFERTFRVEREVAGKDEDDMEAVAAAFGAALGQIVAEIGDTVLGRLGAAPSAEAAPGAGEPGP